MFERVRSSDSEPMRTSVFILFEPNPDIKRINSYICISVCIITSTKLWNKRTKFIFVWVFLRSHKQHVFTKMSKSANWWWLVKSSNFDAHSSSGYFLRSAFIIFFITFVFLFDFSFLVLFWANLIFNLFDFSVSFGIISMSIFIWL